MRLMRAEEARAMAEETRKKVEEKRAELERKKEEAALMYAREKFPSALEDILERIREESSRESNAEYFHHEYLVELGVEVREYKGSKELISMGEKFLAEKLVSQLKELGYEIQELTRESSDGNSEYAPEIIVHSWVVKWWQY